MVTLKIGWCTFLGWWKKQWKWKSCWVPILAHTHTNSSDWLRRSHIALYPCGYYNKASISPFYKIQIPFCRFTIFCVFLFSIKNSTNRPKFTVFLNKQIKIENLGNFLQCSRNTSPGVNKQNGRSANISSHWRAEKGIQTAKVWPQKANKATFWRKSR